MIILSWLSVFLCFCIFSFLLWNLLYRMQGRSRKLKIFYKQEAGWWEKRGHPREGPIESCSVSSLDQVYKNKEKKEKRPLVGGGGGPGRPSLGMRNLSHGGIKSVVQVSGGWNQSRKDWYPLLTMGLLRGRGCVICSFSLGEKGTWHTVPAK